MSSIRRTPLGSNSGPTVATLARIPLTQGKAFHRALLGGLSLGLLLVASSCSNELTGGGGEEVGGVPLPGLNGTLDANGNIVDGEGNIVGTVDGNGNIVDGNGNIVGRTDEGMDSDALLVDVRGDASLGGTGDTGPLTDAEGNPLSLAELPPLQDCATPGPRTIRRLTAEQYMNTLRTVFGNDNMPSDIPLQDAATLGYNVDADDNLVQGLTAQALNSAAEEVAASAVNNQQFMQRVANGCTQNNDNCQRTFVTELGKLISREPMDDSSRIDSYVGLFGAQSQDYQGNNIQLANSFEEGAEMVITAMAQSPYLLYRRELGTLQGNEYQLTQHEIASELSYFLTNNAPDGPLLQAADNNQLGSPDQIQAQADRLLTSDASGDVLARFAHEWIDVSRLQDKAKDGDLSVSLRAAMLEETAQLFLNTFDNGGTISDLFSANYTFINQELSSYYSVGNVNGNDFERVELAGSDRAPGLLGQGAFLSEHALVDNSSPVQRAFAVRERLLCNDLPEPPNDLDTNLKPGDPQATSRERYAAHSDNAVCFSCHRLMDPIGFTFENYDGFGLFRDIEAGQPVDASGGLPVMVGSEFNNVTLPLDGLTQMGSYLAESEAVRACLAKNLSYVAYGIANDDKWPSETKVCNDHAIRQVARDAGNTLSSVLSGILRAPHFTRRVEDI